MDSVGCIYTCMYMCNNNFKRRGHEFKREWVHGEVR